MKHQRNRKNPLVSYTNIRVLIRKSVSKKKHPHNTHEGKKQQSNKTNTTEGIRIKHATKIFTYVYDNFELTSMQGLEKIVPAAKEKRKLSLGA